MSSMLIENRADPRTCGHLDIERLGSDGDASFFRCIACGSIVIAQGMHCWIIRPTDENGPLRF